MKIYLMKKIVLIITYLFIFIKLKNQEIFNGSLYSNISTYILIFTIVYFIYDYYNVLRIIYHKYQTDETTKKFIDKLLPDLGWTTTIIFVINFILSSMIKSNYNKLFHIHYQIPKLQLILKNKIKRYFLIQILLLAYVTIRFVFRMKRYKETKVNEIVNKIKKVDLPQYIKYENHYNNFKNIIKDKQHYITLLNKLEKQNLLDYALKHKNTDQVVNYLYTQLNIEEKFSKSDILKIIKLIRILEIIISDPYFSQLLEKYNIFKPNEKRTLKINNLKNILNLIN